MSRLRLAFAALAVAGLFAGWLWLRDSSLFSVDSVKITGLRGPGAPAARLALDTAARRMTTLHVRDGELRAAVARFVNVERLRVSTQFPHGLAVRVYERPAAGAIVSGAHRIAIAADGSVLAGPAGSALPVLAGPAPAGLRLHDPQTIAALTVLDAAPAALRSRIGRVGQGLAGLTVFVHAGPAIYFGDASRVHAKWAAALSVMADPAARGASYIDVRLPDRPAAQVADTVTVTGSQGTPAVP